MKRIISVLIENEVGALSRVTGLFSQRGYNIESLTVAPTDDVTLSRITLITNDESEKIEQIIKHLYRIVDVYKVTNLSLEEGNVRELVLLKVHAPAKTLVRMEIKQLVDVYRAHIIEVCAQSFTIELVGKSKKIDAFMKSIVTVSQILEIARSGVCGISKSK